MCGSSLHLRVQNTDLQVLERFCEIVGTGKIYGPYTKQFKDGFKRSREGPGSVMDGLPERFLLWRPG